MEMRSRVYAFSGGGTGGHLMPGLALAAALREFDSAAQIEFVGSTKPLERDLVSRQGYPHLGLNVEPLNTLKRAPWQFAIKNWQAYRAAVRWLNARKPACVIGLGGYASAPLVLAAARRRVPTLILEQNVIPGRATQWLAPRVDSVVISFAATRELLIGKLHDLGTPIRSEIAALAVDSAERTTRTVSGLRAGTADPREPILLILGGSQGAEGLNEAVLRMVEKSSDLLAGWKIVHQTGREHVAAVHDRYERQDFNAIATAFIDDMATMLREATLVISRAGATTLAELACAARPTVLVPYPFATDDHQRKNADYFVNANAARLVLQQADPEATASVLRETIEGMLESTTIAEELSTQMRLLARPNATAETLKLILSLCR